jgi:hypothetical protein
VLREEAGNDLLHFNFSGTWLQKLKQKFSTVGSASQKSSDRVKAFEQLRNPLSLCATLWWMYRNGLREELLYISDDVSVLLNAMNDKPKVITTKAAKAIMEAQGFVISATTDKQKQRVVTFDVTISGYGGLVCKVLKFADRDFTQFALKPYVVCMDEENDTERMFVMCYQYGMEDKKVEEAMYRKCILPSVQWHHSNVELRDEGKLEEIQTSPGTLSSAGTGPRMKYSEPQAKGGPSSDSQAQSQSGGADEEVEGEHVEEVEEGEPGNGEYVIHPALAAVLPEVQEGSKGRFSTCGAMWCDGAFGQITALRLAISRRIDKKDMAMLLGKYAGGCSITQSGNNNGQMHITTHSCFNSPSFRYANVKDRPGPRWKALKILLQQSIDPASFKSVWKCMQSAQHFLIKAFSPTSIQSAFSKTGVVPYRPEVILSKFPHFRALDTSQARRVIQSIDHLADLVEGTEEANEDAGVTEGWCGSGPEDGGQVDEDAYLDILGAAIDNTPPKTDKPRNQMGMMSQRSLIINHPNMLRRYANKDEADKAEAEEKVESKMRKAESAAAASMKIEGEEGQQQPKNQKKAKVLRCSNPCCNTVKTDENSFRDEILCASAGPLQLWARCGRVRCNCIFCPACSGRALAAHWEVCDKEERKVTRKQPKTQKK